MKKPKQKTITARYKLTRDIREISKNIFRVQGLSGYCRVSPDLFYDFEGGPFLMVGDDCYSLGIIEKIILRYPEDTEVLPDGYCRVYVQLRKDKK